jgi:hypothetical protein
VSLRRALKDLAEEVFSPHSATSSHPRSLLPPSLLLGEDPDLPF